MREMGLQSLAWPCQRMSLLCVSTSLGRLRKRIPGLNGGLKPSSERKLLFSSKTFLALALYDPIIMARLSLLMVL
jgi:hypothetical protein